MSLGCAEHRDLLVITDEVYVVTRADCSFRIAICRDVIQAIPANLRDPGESSTNLDIHRAYSIPNSIAPRFLAWSSLSEDECLFSISMETALKCMPRALVEFVEVEQRQQVPAKEYQAQLDEAIKELKDLFRPHE